VNHSTSRPPIPHCKRFESSVSPIPAAVLRLVMRDSILSASIHRRGASASCSRYVVGDSAPRAISCLTHSWPDALQQSFDLPGGGLERYWTGAGLGHRYWGAALAGITRPPLRSGRAVRLAGSSCSRRRSCLGRGAQITVGVEH